MTTIMARLFACVGIANIAFLLAIVDFTLTQGQFLNPELDTVEDNLPEFSSPIPNVTVAVGRDAQLPCNIENLGSYKAAWIRVEDKGILTIHDHMITRNYRINLMHDGNKLFKLIIKSVQESDRGFYMCQINTVPMRWQSGYVDVVSPPEIVDNETSSDVVAAEGSNVSLTCKARGNPNPQISWKREDKREIPLQTMHGKKYGVHNLTGEILTLQRVARVHMGWYLCIASNGIQPSVSRRIYLKVQFPPALWLPNQSLNAPLGYEVTLSCHIEAYPLSVNYWVRESTGEIIENSDKYHVAEENKDYKTHLTLTIRTLEREDLGGFICLAKNTLGKQEGTVRIQEVADTHKTRGSSSKRRQYKQQQKDGQYQSNFASKSSQSSSAYDEDTDVPMAESAAMTGWPQPDSKSLAVAFVCLTTTILARLLASC